LLDVEIGMHAGIASHSGSLIVNSEAGTPRLAGMPIEHAAGLSI
jgi:hypothetical protein